MFFWILRWFWIVYIVYLCNVAILTTTRLVCCLLFIQLAPLWIMSPLKKRRWLPPLVYIFVSVFVLMLFTLFIAFEHHTILSSHNYLSWLFSLFMAVINNLFYGNLIFFWHKLLSSYSAHWYHITILSSIVKPFWCCLVFIHTNLSYYYTVSITIIPLHFKP